MTYPSICKNLLGWCVVIKTKPREHVQVDKIQDELSYQVDETLNVLLVTTIEHFQGLVDTSIVEVLDHDNIKLVLDESGQDLDLSNEDKEVNGNNDEDNSESDDNND